MLSIGIDLGGTKIEGVVVSHDAADDTPNVLARRRIATERERGYEHIVSAVAALIGEVAELAGLSAAERATCRIGVGMPGSVNRAGVVKNSNTTCLNGRPFRQDLVAKVEKPIAFSNDANCFTLAEACYGAGRKQQVVFGVILGTGVGGGIACAPPQGLPRTWDGRMSIAGEWGHVALEPQDGPPCYCGRRGCIETLLSGPALEAHYAKRSGHKLPLFEIAARTADPHAQAVWNTALSHFGRALATVINILDPDVIVLGGGVSKLDLWYERGPQEVARWVFGGEFDTPIVRHQIGDSAGVLGAALLVPTV